MDTTLYQSKSFNWADDVNDSIESGELASATKVQSQTSDSGNESDDDHWEYDILSSDYLSDDNFSGETSFKETEDSETKESMDIAASDIDIEAMASDNHDPVEPREFSECPKSLYEWVNGDGYTATAEEILAGKAVPSLIGTHVWDENFDKGKRKAKFVKFHHQDLIVKSTLVLDRMGMAKYAIAIEEAKVTKGEWGLLRDKQLSKYRCRPSSLRKSWSMK